MKNKIQILILICSFFFNFVTTKAEEQFNFDVTQVEIEDDGNIFKGLSGGTATTDDGLIIIADEFEYNKALNILTGIGNIEINDTVNDYIIFAEKIIYFKNIEKILTVGKTKSIIEKNYTFNSSDVIYLKNQQNDLHLC